MGRATTNGTGIDVVLSADHTYSTSPAIEEVKDNFQDITRQLSRVPGMRFGVLDHGDYESQPYVNAQGLTTDLRLVLQRLKAIRPNGGSGRGANYAQTMRAARLLNWQAMKSRCLILAGDEIPRPSHLYRGEWAVDADNEIELLRELNIKVFAVQLLGLSHATAFYKKLAAKTGGVYLPLEQMYQLPLMVVGICLLQQSEELFDEYANQIASARGYTRNVETLFTALRGKAPARKARRAAAANGPLQGVVEMDPARFQIMVVSGPEVKIADFVRGRQLQFQTGRGFYLHDFRTEEVQDYKEIVLRDQDSGVWYAAENQKGRAGIRAMLGIGTTGTVKLEPNPLAGYDVWIQSTSPNRVLNRGGRTTEFAYEVPPADGSPVESTSAAALKKKHRLQSRR